VTGHHGERFSPLPLIIVKQPACFLFYQIGKSTNDHGHARWLTLISLQMASVMASP
jgi:hypothetical protein